MRLKLLIKEKWWPVVIYSLVALVIMLPLLRPGYIFALDMVFGPHLHLPHDVSSSYLFYLVLKIFNFVLPSQVIQKLMLFSILFLSGLGAHRLADSFNTDKKIKNASFFAGLIYMINPFTYERFMDGQFSVLLGYALLPFFVLSLFKFLFTDKPNWPNALKLAGWILLMSIVSIHSLGFVALLLITGLGLYFWQARADAKKLKNIIGLSLFVLVIVFAASSYWLVPVIRGHTPRAKLIQQFDDRHLLSFRTDGANSAGVVGNVISLQGYWGEREGRFKTIKQTIPWWPVLAIVIISLGIYGLTQTWRDKRVQTLTIAALIALILAIGIAAKPFSYLNYWLLDHLPFFRGFREPQKFVAIIALWYAVLGSVGLAKLSTILKTSKNWLFGFAFALPFLFTPTMLAGFANQLQPANYPSDWSVVNSQLKRRQGAILFLPWHEYMYFDFAKRDVVNPAPRFFDGKVISGKNSEIGLINYQVNDSTSQSVDRLLATGQADGDISTQLKQLGVTYIVVAKTANWRDYDFLDNQTKLKLKSSYKTLKIYQVLN